ncbi:MAG: 16S rRNA (guanine(527)-N(7))-methyltransferase RsmG [Acidobacteria bacterium]|nr:MAG: 16S rRNA (guanine(527)-N(7))-methyltransferase RsmG [Acidobacteriota bacterium]
MTTREFNERLGRRARRAGLQVGPELARLLEQYVRLLALWNERINLTGLPVREPSDETVDRLIIEPLAAARHLPPGTASVIDIGTGGGSPAIPMKLAVPALRMRMVESKTRKSAFLQEAIRHLGLQDTVVETARYQELLTRPDLHEAHDVLTVRAVRVEMRVLVTLQAFVSPGGRLFLFRGPSETDGASGLTPPLVWEGAYPIGDLFSGRLVVLRKTPVGSAVAVSAVSVPPAQAPSRSGPASRRKQSRP